MNISRRALLAGSPILLRGQAAGKRVVLTFDDAVKSHRTFVGPLLQELGFRATFFVTHAWMPDAEHFLTWQEIAELHGMGFEIGNHSWSHAGFSSPANAARLAGELALVENELQRVKVPRPVSFAWCGNAFGPEALAVLRERGYRFARRGGVPEVEYGKVIVGPRYDPRVHDRLLIPTTGDAYPDWTFAHFQRVMESAREGQIVVLQFHGVPDAVHPWVNTPPERFREYMSFLKREGFQTMALRDLGPIIDTLPQPQDPLTEKRFPVPKEGRLSWPAEVEATRADLRYWRHNMLADHHYTPAEAAGVAGMRVEEMPRVEAPSGEPDVRIRPYPGGRPLRLGFREGAIDPLRGTKASVFLPWDPNSYVVVDLPEAIFSNLGLLFLAHTHVPTIWNDRNTVIANHDWVRTGVNALESHWKLPNGIEFGAAISGGDREVKMDLWLRNGTGDLLTGLRTQICVLLKEAAGFKAQENGNKSFGKTKAAVTSMDGKRRIETEWERCGRTWGNAACPCMHSDPVLPDCAPGETVRVSGRLWFAGS